MKTPEELAEEYADTQHYSVDQEWSDSYKGFLAGYNAAAPQWVSVKERLPEINTLVVILHEDEMKLNHRNPPVYFGKYNGNYWLETLDHSDVMLSGLCNVTHWMPLPAPPKEEV